jgi:hypothetical protein
MAAIVKVDSKNARGAELADALESIRAGLATLHKLDGLRAQTIAVSATEFGATFGVVAEPQALSDRLAAIEGGVYTGLNDLLDAFVADPGIT